MLTAMKNVDARNVAGVGVFRFSRACVEVSGLGCPAVVCLANGDRNGETKHVYSRGRMLFVEPFYDENWGLGRARLGLACVGLRLG